MSTTGTKASAVGAINPFRYRGYVYDTESGLYYLQSRYYNPEWGRFVNGDKYISTGQGQLGNNMYIYCLNNPVRNIDSEGTLATITFAFEVTLSTDIGVLPRPYGGLLPGTESLPWNISIPSFPSNTVSTNFIGPMPFDYYFPTTSEASSSSPASSSSALETPTTKTRSPDPIAGRYTYSSRKKAEQDARRASGGKKPILHPPENGRPPHFHPNVDQIYKITRNTVTKHDHYYFPKSQFSWGIYDYNSLTGMPIIKWSD